VSGELALPKGCNLSDVCLTHLTCGSAAASAFVPFALACPSLTALHFELPTQSDSALALLGDACGTLSRPRGPVLEVLRIGSIPAAGPTAGLLMRAVRSLATLRELDLSGPGMTDDLTAAIVNVLRAALQPLFRKHVSRSRRHCPCAGRADARERDRR
jgi:hypothetical protein